MKIPLDPEPWYVEEDESRHPFERVRPMDSTDAVSQLSIWAPRQGYEQDQDKYTPAYGSEGCPVGPGIVRPHILEAHGPWFNLTVLCRVCGYILVEEQREQALAILR